MAETSTQPSGADPVAQWPDAITLAQLRVRIGLPADDVSRDDDLTAVWNMATDLAEAYLDRYVRPGAYTETFTHITKAVLGLRGYPVIGDPVVLDLVSAAQPKFHVDAAAGLIHFDGVASSHSLSVEYVCAPPRAIGVALVGLFDSIWALADASGMSVSSGGIKSISSAGSTVTYFDPSAGGGAGGIDEGSGFPAGVAALLNPYRRRTC